MDDEVNRLALIMLCGFDGCEYGFSEAKGRVSAVQYLLAIYSPDTYYSILNARN
jgi:hypothetical protein